MIAGTIDELWYRRVAMIFDWEHCIGQSSVKDTRFGFSRNHLIWGVKEAVLPHTNPLSYSIAHTSLQGRNQSEGTKEWVASPTVYRALGGVWGKAPRTPKLC